MLRSHHALFWGVSLLVVLVGYRDVVFGGKTFLPIGVAQGTYAAYPFAAGYKGPAAPEVPEIDAGAEAWFVHPLAYQERRALASGTLPFWNAHNGLGWPLLADGQTATLSPLHWIELIRPDRPWLWDLHDLLIRWLAAVFTCYLVWRMGARPGVAAIGAPIAALHGSFSALVNRGDLNAYALLPALLFCLLRLRQEPGWRWSAALAAAMYLVLTAGHPEPAVAILLTAALVAPGLAFLGG
ncbi:MAG TPA: hypothetical protein VH083_06455, partial [Myxococcales bacterium]|nr:hypothetical protein [Myxococcales bacterium]